MRDKVKRELLRLSGNGLLMRRGRGALLRFIGLNIHPNSEVCRGSRFGGFNITTGDNSKIGEQCWIDSEVIIEDNTFVGSRVMIITGTHPVGGADCRRGESDIRRPVSIGRGSWVGNGAIIQPGVNIASGCVICPGAVVTKSTAPNGMYAGVPAVRIKELSDD